VSTYDWHREIVSEIVQHLDGKYRVRAPYNLPGQTRESALYQPDIVVFDKETGELRYIIEVETSSGGKSVAGATILAEVCVAQTKQRLKPSLFFIVKDDGEEHELEKLRKRIQLIRYSLKQPILDKVIIQRKQEFISGIGAL